MDMGSQLKTLDPVDLLKSSEFMLQEVTHSPTKKVEVVTGYKWLHVNSEMEK